MSDFQLFVYCLAGGMIAMIILIGILTQWLT